ncbi:MAG: type VI secretion system baseplate subunit TssG [Hyphomicrobiales bacterium]|nr:type VI secretion system baseplate subunit TssG [Hyphomicrobiales bacterium]MBV8663153.1 type VI secretion system baseplate subunit TssG [Hyphomicrobiales bacterium]
MADAERRRTLDLSPEAREALALAPFFQLAELAQRLYPTAVKIGSTRAPAREAVRFKGNPSFAFPAAEIASVEPSEELEDGLDVRLNLFGLYGPSSPLPTSFTERIIHSENANALGDFLDLFNHRLASLLYLVWRQYQHHLRFEHGGVDAISQAVAALFGLPPLVGEEAADDRRIRLLPYVGLLAMESRSASSLARVVSHVFSIPCEIEEFIPRWISIPDEARFALGGEGMELGVATILGEAMPDVTGQFRIWCGPMSFERYRDFLPNRPDSEELSRLIDFVVREPLARDVAFRIEAGTTPEWALGEGELGWTTWAAPSHDLPVEALI